MKQVVVISKTGAIKLAANMTAEGILYFPDGKVSCLTAERSQGCTVELVPELKPLKIESKGEAPKVEIKALEIKPPSVEQSKPEKKKKK
jgi:hypothetical protein